MVIAKNWEIGWRIFMFVDINFIQCDRLSEFTNIRRAEYTTLGGNTWGDEWEKKHGEGRSGGEG